MKTIMYYEPDMQNILDCLAIVDACEDFDQDMRETLADALVRLQGITGLSAVYPEGSEDND